MKANEKPVCSICGQNGEYEQVLVSETSVDTWTHDDGQSCSIADLSLPPAAEYFLPDPSPYTLSSLRTFRDAHGNTHYW